MDLCSTWECKGISQVTHMKEVTFSMEGIWKGYLFGEKKCIKWKRFGQGESFHFQNRGHCLA